MANPIFWRDRVAAFRARFGGDLPVLLAPMAGACPADLSIAVMRAGGWGAAGALLMGPDEIARWCKAVRAGAEGPFQLNLWIPEGAVQADPAVMAAQAGFLQGWTDEVGTPGGPAAYDFAAQCEAVIAAGPAAISSMMGVFPPDVVTAMKARGIAWFATATTVEEARIAAAAGADAVIAQGAEAGGHRGSFDPASAERNLCGLFALLPAVVDAVDVPVIAAGGISDARGVAAALMLGAAAVQIGTGFLRAPESDAPAAWKDALAATGPGDTMLTRAFTGRAGRALATDYVRAASAPDAPAPAPHPLQRELTKPMTRKAKASGDLARMQAWSGQSARLARAEPAGTVARALWEGAVALLG